MDKEVKVIPFKNPARLTPSLRELHKIPDGKVLVGHKIVVEGFYSAAPQKTDEAGHWSKRRVAYREQFELAAHEHRLTAQGSLGHILSDKFLAARLSKNDPEFRAILTHKVVAHENMLADEPKAEADEPEPKAELTPGEVFT